MRNKLEQLEENIILLRKIRDSNTLEKALSSKDIQWSIRYGLMESIQIVIDISCHVCAKKNLGAPESYGDCIRKLAQFNYIPAKLAEKLVSAAGLRNLLIHQYAVIKIEKLYSFLDELSVFSEFVPLVYPYLN